MTTGNPKIEEPKQKEKQPKRPGTGKDRRDAPKKDTGGQEKPKETQ